MNLVGEPQHRGVTEHRGARLAPHGVTTAAGVASMPSAANCCRTRSARPPASRDTAPLASFDPAAPSSRNPAPSSRDPAPSSRDPAPPSRDPAPSGRDPAPIEPRPGTTEPRPGTIKPRHRTTCVCGLGNAADGRAETRSCRRLRALAASVGDEAAAQLRQRATSGCRGCLASLKRLAQARFGAQRASQRQPERPGDLPRLQPTRRRPRPRPTGPRSAV
jgi:hypothetical protein